MRTPLLMNTVAASFNTALRQMTEMSQWQKCLIKKITEMSQRKKNNSAYESRSPNSGDQFHFIPRIAQTRKFWLVVATFCHDIRFPFIASRSPL